jgi:hypothetical protein
VGAIAVASPVYAVDTCAAPVVAGNTVTVTCSAGDTGTVTVPAGVLSGVVTLDGAGGGSAADGTLGGKGAHVVATLPFTPGQTLLVTVGAKGNDGVPNPQFGIGGGGGSLVAVTTVKRPGVVSG